MSSGARRRRRNPHITPQSRCVVDLTADDSINEQHSPIILDDVPDIDDSEPILLDDTDPVIDLPDLDDSDVQPIEPVHPVSSSSRRDRLSAQQRYMNLHRRPPPKRRSSDDVVLVAVRSNPPRATANSTPPVNPAPPLQSTPPSQPEPYHSDLEELLQFISENSASASSSLASMSTSPPSSQSEEFVIPQRKMLTCPVCLDHENQILGKGSQLMSTNCGHIFCDDCIFQTIRSLKCCPTCRKKLTKKSVHPIFM